MNEQLEQALQQIEEEKGISRQELLGMIEASLAAAFRKDYGQKNQNIVVEFSAENKGVELVSQLRVRTLSNYHKYKNKQKRNYQLT
jgi:N utilization substance protein A